VIQLYCIPVQLYQRLSSPEGSQQVDARTGRPESTQTAQDDGRQTRQPGIQVIQRAAGILDALHAADASLSLGQLARETGLARSTVQRIVEALQHVGWVTPPSPNGGVLLGPGLT
jgi:response regulator of citrate/malate metabolism